MKRQTNVHQDNSMGSGGMLSLLASVICGEMNGLPRQ
ncbi:hypothetical protein OOU_Y34scaffold00159g4 [Pyricularia oryzae Y34]|uniref:Uncharacterized protein n=1 Tax=Pyricularia oryzae (strain Y34) TaxID=1143189 RepID=A0AA97PQN0_PYRO3|nr:hypothetical protein OOU_Y34scaffold00159g4 [Pyricularia oryzae Y34]